MPYLFMLGSENLTTIASRREQMYIIFSVHF